MAARLKYRVQITSDGRKPYVVAVEAAFGMEVDYSILQKMRSGIMRGQRAVLEKRGDVWVITDLSNFAA